MALLEEFEWFDGGQCTSVSPAPDASPRPERVEFVLRDGGVGGLRPGDVRTYRALRLEARDVRAWSFDGADVEIDPGHLISELDALESPVGFGLTVDLPTVVRLVATSFRWERLPDVTEAFAAWVSDRELFVTVPRDSEPPPAGWIEAIGEHGIEVGWRCYGGPITPPHQMPAEGYDGWFLERPERVAAHDGGLQVLIDRRAGGRTFKFCRSHGNDDDLWAAVSAATVTMFPDGEFFSGNSRFSASEWLAQLTSATAPLDPARRNGVAVRSSYLREAHPMEVPKGSDPTTWRVRT